MSERETVVCPELEPVLNNCEEESDAYLKTEFKKYDIHTEEVKMETVGFSEEGSIYKEQVQFNGKTRAGLRINREGEVYIRQHYNAQESYYVYIKDRDLTDNNQLITKLFEIL